MNQVVAWPMSRADSIRAMTDVEMAKVMLEICRSDLNDSGDLYELWCDELGGCIGSNGEDLCPDGCSEEMKIACILRYLQAPGGGFLWKDNGGHHPGELKGIMASAPSAAKKTKNGL